MVWISNQSTDTISVSLTKITGGSDATYSLPAKANETYKKNHWNRSGTEFLKVTFSNGKTKDASVEKDDFVLVYDDTIITRANALVDTT